MLTDLEKDAIRHHYQTLAGALPGFKPRAAQRQMIAAIAKTLSQSLERAEGEDLPERAGESILVVEGPTGVGKSVAYLIAGGVIAKSRGRKLVVSSATVALQEQLVHRDLPFVVENSELPLTFALAKGRGRYVCPYRLYQHTADTTQGELLAADPMAALWERKPEAAELATLKQLADGFYYRKWSGDRDDYPQTLDDSLWGRITNDRHGCLKAACPNRPECPFYAAREALDNVDVVVTNHDLLLADCAMGGGVILPAPEQTFYILDEAHHLAKKAVNQFAADFVTGPTLGWLDKVATLVSRLDGFISKPELGGLAIDSAAAAIEHLTELVAVLDGVPELTAPEGAEPLWLLPAGDLPEGLVQLASNLAMVSAALEKQLGQLSGRGPQGARSRHAAARPLRQRAGILHCPGRAAGGRMAAVHPENRRQGAADCPLDCRTGERQPARLPHLGVAGHGGRRPGQHALAQGIGRRADFGHPAIPQLFRPAAAADRSGLAAGNHHAGAGVTV